MIGEGGYGIERLAQCKTTVTHSYLPRLMIIMVKKRIMDPMTAMYWSGVFRDVTGGQSTYIQPSSRLYQVLLAR